MVCTVRNVHITVFSDYDMKDNSVLTSCLVEKNVGNKGKCIVLDLQQKYEAIKKLDKGIPAYKIDEELCVGTLYIYTILNTVRT